MHLIRDPHGDIEAQSQDTGRMTPSGGEDAYGGGHCPVGASFLGETGSRELGVGPAKGSRNFWR